MAYLNQAQYDFRARSAAQRMQDNKEECDTLTEEQHDALADTAKSRHILHGHCVCEGMYLTESQNYDLWRGMRGLLDCEATGDRGDINRILTEAGLPIIEGLHVAEDLPTDQWRDYISTEDAAEECGYVRPDGIDDEEYEEQVGDAYYDSAIRRTYEEGERINTMIESYLRDIDRKHGTNYAPSGALRI